MFQRSAISSALSPSEIVHCSGISGLTIRQPSVVENICSWERSKPRSGFSTTQGARLIDSTPPIRTSEASPVSIARLACMPASRLDAQRRLTVLPGTLVGRPASSAAIRATFLFSSPAPLALPKVTSSMLSGSRPGERSISARTTWAPGRPGGHATSPPA